jgi:NAD(P)H dehydrogenase (quinone)
MRTVLFFQVLSVQCFRFSDYNVHLAKENSMKSIAIIYFSGSGHTHLMAEAIAAGIGVDAKTTLLRITGEQINQGRWKSEEFMQVLQQVDGIIFGSPTYMGGVASQFKAFADAASSIWSQQGWKDKVAGGFTHSAGLSGDKQGTLLYMAINAAQHGLIWVGAGEMTQPNGVNRLGSYLGVMGQGLPDFTGTQPVELDSGDRKSCELYGQRIAQAVARWNR